MSRRACLGFAALWAALAGCGSPAPATYVWVDVQARPAVRGVATLEVTVSDGGDRVTRTFGAGALALPSAFTVTPNAHGTLTVAGTAKDAAGLVVAAATATVEVVAGGRADTTVLLEPTDFQVNTTVAGSQIVTDYDGGRAGRQLAAAADGSFAMIFENIGDLGRFDAMGRLFDPDGAPRQNATSLSADDFILNAGGTESVYFVAAAAAPAGGFLAIWVDAALSTVNARRFDETGEGGTELSVASLTVPAAGVPSAGAGAAAALRDGGFVVVFTQQRSATDSTLELHARLLDATGAPRPNHTGSALAFPLGAATTHSRERPAVAAGADGAFLVAWLDANPATADAAIVVQRFDQAGQAQGAEIIIQPLGTGLYSEAPNLAATPDGYFVVFADDPTAAGDTDIFVRFVATSGVAGVPAYRVTTSTTGDQTDPAVAAAPDGRALVVWTDGQSRPEDTEPASIRGRLLQPLGLPLGADFAVNTTTTRNQILPSVAAAGHDAFVVAWEDYSAVGPDTDGSGIRARFLYPDFAPTDGRLGAGCDPVACQRGLVCLARAAGAFCHQGCTSAQVGSACASGGMCADVSGAAGPACLFR
ncbi:MAG TPA: hypothetical protein VGQ83_06135 [Polyangia bacterium]|jgi:hypothetical protein